MSELMDLYGRIGYTFHDPTLLTLAMTHSSFANEKGGRRGQHNERLEFLGDAVLEIVSSEYLYFKHPDKPEGELSRLRASMVCEPTLAICAREIGIPPYLRMGRGEEMNGGRRRDSVISDALEALIGAIYLDGGFECARNFIRTHILNDIENKRLFVDSKTNLQEIVQARGESIEYRLDGEEGPPHDRTFSVTVLIGGKEAGTGQGHSKKAAEQHAAYEAIRRIRS